MLSAKTSVSIKKTRDTLNIQRIKRIRLFAVPERRKTGYSQILQPCPPEPADPHPGPYSALSGAGQTNSFELSCFIRG